MANPIFTNLPTTVFEEMSGLARALGAINLGQGFPDAPGPEAIRRKAAELVVDGYNQYPPMRGLPELRQAVADHYAAHQGLDLDWDSEVTVTSGATEALAPGPSTPAAIQPATASSEPERPKTAPPVPSGD